MITAIDDSNVHLMQTRLSTNSHTEPWNWNPLSTLMAPLRSRISFGKARCGNALCNRRWRPRAM